MPEPPHPLVDHLFRHSAGQMVATLTRVFGPENVSLAEEVVQDALVTALQQWPLRGVPENPAAWLYQVARNRALDQLRRGIRGQTFAFQESENRMSDPTAFFAHEFQDDQLQMMLVCCHPAIPEDSRVALTLKTVGGFSIEEIAQAFLAKAETIAQRVVRAKRLIREEKIPFEMPARDELHPRLDSLLKVLYLMFNEGYSAHSGEDLIRRDLCTEAIRLTRMVADHPVGGTPAVSALLALMLLQAARLPARVDAAGELMILSEQDRSLWDGSLLTEGMRRLETAASGDRITTYHLEAALAACHSTAPSFEETDWDRVVDLYDELLVTQPSSVVALNRAIAIAMRDGPQSGIAAIESIEPSKTLHDYLPLSTALGELCLRAGDAAGAAAHFRRALALPSTTPEKRFLMRKLEQCGLSSRA